MNYFSFRILIKRIKAIKFMMADPAVPKKKKALIIAGLVYLLLPVDLIPPVIFPIGFLDDFILWVFILWHLKDTLDVYWMGNPDDDLSKKYDGKEVINDVNYNVVHDESETDGGSAESGANAESSGDNSESKA